MSIDIDSYILDGYTPNRRTDASDVIKNPSAIPADSSQTTQCAICGLCSKPLS
jgi:hypothetical protein